MSACSWPDKMMHIIFRPEAAADIAMAVDWYELQQPGLGESFLGEVKYAADYVVGVNPNLVQ